MRKPSYSVVTGVVGILVAVGFVAHWLEPLIPPPPPNRLAAEPGVFMRQAERQAIDWRPLDGAALAEARRSGRPILLVIGTPWSRFGRHMDERVFSDPEVARFAHLNFVCVRVDATESPEWLSAYMPLSRLRVSFLPGFQIAILDPGGRLMAFYVRQRREEVFDYRTVMTILTRSRDAHVAAQSGSPSAPIGSLQQAELLGLRQPEGQTPDFEAYGHRLTAYIHPEHGGIVEGDFQVLRPNVWRYMFLDGRHEEARRSLDAVLTSPLVDLIDGGFFRQSNANFRSVEVAKIAKQNAEMAQLLATLSQAWNAPLYAEFSRQAFDGIVRGMVENELIAATRVPDDDLRLRSRRSSFPPVRLRELLNAGDRRWAIEALGLDAATFPQMIPHLRRPDAIGTEPYVRVLQRLHAGAGPRPPLAGVGSTEATGFSLARLIQACRILGDGDRLAQTAPLLDSLEKMLLGAELLPHRGARASSHYLGDYLAFADAALHDYLANGRTVSFERGLAVLLHAQNRFAGEVPGEYVAMLPETVPPGMDAVAPEVADVVRESLTAQMVRLANAYGSLVAPGPEASGLRQSALTAASRYSAALVDAGPAAAGLMCAFRELEEDRMAVTVGPRSQELADALIRRAPTRLVAPAFGVVRPDLRAREPGVYVVVRGAIEGPLDVEKAAARLSGRGVAP
jgi:uncharacterized protein